MRRLKNMHILLVKLNYDKEKKQSYTTVFVDDVLLQKFEG